MAKRLTQKTDSPSPGRPPLAVVSQDLDVIERMAGLGSTLDDIACVLGISSATLDRWLKLPEVELAYKKGRAIAKKEMATKLWDMAMAGEVTAAIFWLKSQAGWVDKPKDEHPVSAQVVVYVPDNGR